MVHTYLLLFTNKSRGIKKYKPTRTKKKAVRISTTHWKMETRWMSGVWGWQRKTWDHLDPLYLPAQLCDTSFLISADYLSALCSVEFRIQTWQVQAEPGKRHRRNQGLKFKFAQSGILLIPFSWWARGFLETRLLPTTPGKRLENSSQGKPT